MASSIGQPCVTGSLTQIIARGSLCQFLKSDESTCFRTRYTRTTNFAAESSYQNFSGVTAFGSQANVTLQRQGDLVGNQYLVVDLPSIELVKVASSTQPWVNNVVKTAEDADNAVFAQYGKTADEGKKYWRTHNYSAVNLDACEQAPNPIDNEAYCHWANGIGYLICKEATLMIGGAVIDQLWSELLWAWAEISGVTGKLALEVVGKAFDKYTLICNSSTQRRLWVHLPWFHAKTGSSLSLASLAFHGISLTFTFEQLEKCIVVHVPKGDKNKYEVRNGRTGTAITANDLHAELMTQFYFLDTVERDKFASANYEMLVCTHQRQIHSGNTKDVRMGLNFNHALIELIWMLKRKSNIDSNQHFNFSGIDGRDPIEVATLSLNNQPRFSNVGPYFRLVVPSEVHSRVPEAYIYNYSFAINPEQWEQPSGSLNASRIDNIALDLQLQSGLENENYYIHVYARSYNVLRFRQGLAGLAFAN